MEEGKGLKATKQAHFMAYKKEKEKGNPYFVKVGQFSKDALGGIGNVICWYFQVMKFYFLFFNFLEKQKGLR